jgi:hypothetical protein
MSEESEHEIEITNEPPRVRAGASLGVGGRVRLIDAATGKQVDERTGGTIYENECREREEASAYQEIKGE